MALAWAMLAFAAPPPGGIEIAVIAADPPPRIDADTRSLRDIFLKRRRFDADGLPLVPLNLPPDSPLREAFSEAVLGQSPRMLAQYWNERYFQGVSPPYVVRSQEAMLRFVAATPGALGYVMACHADGRVHVVARVTVRGVTAAGRDGCAGANGPVD
ncbi:hypothetical protein KBTX_03016 [wastewater metagenome]|uniref:Phosphate ABC transporter substrate-binding protein n=2 Tax=unclassified sequences TaxID=12908 RepID=A0A5B8RDK2_9ZZZZ|nr:hypothetical protein [Arhodomonas sp. KWT]QEA06676.1 hypothetical protein KBTEX_03016 [uncultured organism]